VKTLFQRPDKLDAPLDVIVTVFNSARYRSRWKHYEDFISMAERAGKAVRLWTVEVAFGDRAFAVTDRRNRRHLQLRTNSEIWHKERSQNLMLARVVTEHPDSAYIAFIDADITFARHDWADETRHALQHFSVVQMWQEAHDLDAAGNIIQQHASFANCYAKDMPLDRDGNSANYYYPSGKGRIYFHPGYAWAWRREALDSVGGLIDFAILGSADFHMAHALVGNVDATLRRSLGKRYADKMRDWQRLSERDIKRNLGCVPGSILHYYHGAKANRGYKSRWKILEETQFNPDKDLMRDAQGLYQLQSRLGGGSSARSNALRDKVRKYFHARNEDA